MAGDDEFDRWISPIEMMLNTLTNKKVRGNSIVDIPEHLKKSNMKAYKPKVVSIGPLHRKSSRELLYMKEIKWQCMLSLLHRLNPTDDQKVVPPKRLKDCGEVILKYDEAVRACYMDPIELDRHELAQIMLVDGCFLLEFLLITNDKQLNGEPKSKFPVKVSKREEFLSDLKLLENQIPLFIIDLLYLKLFGKKSEGILNIINGYALYLFGCSSGRPIISPNRAHFLELTHWFLTSRQIEAKPDQERSAPETVVELTIDPPDHEHMESMDIWLRERDERDKKVSKETTPKLERCAARLQAAGVKIKTFYGKNRSSSKLEKDPVSVMFGCKEKFEQGVLEIQSLCVTEETELQWRNFIAWEQTRSAEKTWEQTGTPATEKKFSQYALLFKGLVCCEYDIELLKSAKVLKVHDENKWSNEKVNKFIHDIAEGIQIDASADPKFCEMINDLNSCDKGCCRFIMFKHCCRILLTKARKFCRYLYRLLMRDYCSTPWKTLGVMAAVLLLFLTIAQTVLAAIAL
ncbi:hypothetical protein JHK87_001402 [Glycine soja]|nr:hypothetical protein JHK87_001402 [Glycine soja]